MGRNFAFGEDRHDKKCGRSLGFVLGSKMVKQKSVDVEGSEDQGNGGGGAAEGGERASLLSRTPGLARCSF